MNTKKLLLAVLLAAAFAPVSANAFDGDEEPPIRERIVTINGAEGFHLGGPLMRMGHKAVKGAPYSAEVVNERQQNLADGNQIVNKSSAKSYRNSAGATRQEMIDAKGEVRSIVLHDPAEGSTITLNPQDKTATRMVFKTVDGAKREEMREEIRARIEKQRAERGGAQGDEIVIKRVERLDGEAQKRIQENVRVQVAKAVGEARTLHGADMGMQIGPVIAGAFGDMKWSGKATTKDLGAREIDGVKAEGKLRSYEIPAGELGNRNPIVVSDESWYSPELQVTVYSKHSDPRSGDRIYRLASLKREEPPASLFTVPAGYTVKEAEGRRVIVEKK